MKTVKDSGKGMEKKGGLPSLDMGDLLLRDREALGLDIFRKTRKGPQKLSFFTQGGELGLMEWLADKYPNGRKGDNVLLGHKAKMQKKSDYDATQLALQQYLPARARRKLTDDEQAAIEKETSHLLPRIFKSYGTPLPEMMASPSKQALLAALLLGGAGALGGGMLGSGIGGARGAGIGAGLGGLGAGTLAALTAYFSRKAENEGIREMMTRLPEGATRRDYLSDPAVQKDRDMAMQSRQLRAMQSLAAPQFAAMLGKESAELPAGIVPPSAAVRREPSSPMATAARNIAGLPGAEAERYLSLASPEPSLVQKLTRAVGGSGFTPAERDLLADAATAEAGYPMQQIMDRMSAKQRQTLGRKLHTFAEPFLDDPESVLKTPAGRILHRQLGGDSARLYKILDALPKPPAVAAGRPSISELREIATGKGGPSIDEGGFLDYLLGRYKPTKAKAVLHGDPGPVASGALQRDGSMLRVGTGKVDRPARLQQLAAAPASLSSKAVPYKPGFLENLLSKYKSMPAWAQIGLPAAVLGGGGLGAWLASRKPKKKDEEKEAMTTNALDFADALMFKLAESSKKDKPCPGSKIRSKGKGRGLGRGKGKGPIGIPIGEKKAKMLTTKARTKIKKKDFAIPSKAENKGEKAESGNYPIPDKAHARNALARVSQHGSSSEKAQVRAKVHAKYPGIGEKEAKVKDLIPGGKAKGKSSKNYSAKQLRMGVKVEKEHTPDPAKAREIAKDHLEEFKDYYTRLDKMEAEAKAEACPGSKIRSQGKGRGLGRGKGKGPIGIPIGEKGRAKAACSGMGKPKRAPSKSYTRKVMIKKALLGALGLWKTSATPAGTVRGAAVPGTAPAGAATGANIAAKPLPRNVEMFKNRAAGTMPTNVSPKLKWTLAQQAARFGTTGNQVYSQLRRAAMRPAVRGVNTVTGAKAVQPHPDFGPVIKAFQNR